MPDSMQHIKLTNTIPIKPQSRNAAISAILIMQTQSLYIGFCYMYQPRLKNAKSCCKAKMQIRPPPPARGTRFLYKAFVDRVNNEFGVKRLNGACSDPWNW